MAYRATPMIVRTSSGQLYRVRETGNPDLEHVWIGRKIKSRRNAKTGELHEDKRKDCEMLVRKAGSVIIEETPP